MGQDFSTVTQPIMPTYLSGFIKTKTKKKKKKNKQTNKQTNFSINQIDMNYEKPKK